MKRYFSNKPRLGYLLLIQVIGTIFIITFFNYLVKAGSQKKIFGVTMAGGEFGQNTLPGVMNNDYIYPTDNREYSYFAEKGLTIIRLPIRWERVQEIKFGPLRTDDIKSIHKAIDVAAKNYQKVILDLHNFGYYYGRPLTTKDADSLSDVWTKLVQEFNESNIYGYELMNEPHDLPDGTKGWQQIVQETVYAIRQVDKSHTILIPGYDWQSASRWRSSNESLSINDPAHNLLYAAHEYFDKDYSGTYKKSYEEEESYPRIGADRLGPFQAWLKKRNFKGIITEYGVPNSDDRWLVVLDIFMKSINNDNNILGGVYWAAGPWYGDYPLSVDPLKKVNPVQMKILSKYTSDK